MSGCIRRGRFSWAPSSLVWRPARARRIMLLLAPPLALTLAWTLPVGARVEATLLGQELVWLRADGLARPFAIIFALFGGLGLLYGWSGSRRVHAAGLAATGAALGIALAGDWVTFYLGLGGARGRIVRPGRRTGRGHERKRPHPATSSCTSSEASASWRESSATSARAAAPLSVRPRRWARSS